MADKTNGDKNINATFWATWSKFYKTDSPEDAKIMLLEVSSLWNSEQIAATTKRTVTIVFYQNFGSN